MQQYTQRDQLALQIINLAKAEVLLENPFLAEVIGRLTEQPAPMEGSLSAPKELRQFTTNGQTMGFDAGAVMANFRTSGGKSPKHDLLHSAVHCVFLHPFVGQSINADWWNIAADMAAERVVAEVLGPREEPRGSSIARTLSWVEDQLGCRATAERIYHRLASGQWENMMPVWEMLFTSDEHLCWYAPPTVDQGLSSDETEEGEEEDRSNIKGDQEPPAGAPKDAEGDPNLQQQNTAGQGQNMTPDENASCEEDVPAPDDLDAGPDGAADEMSPVDPQEDTAESANPQESGTTDQALPREGAVRQAPDQEAPGVNRPNDQATDPGTTPSTGQASARAQGEGAGTGKESYLSQRAGMDLRLKPGTDVAALREEWAKVATNLSVNLQTYAKDKASAFSGFVADLEQTTARPVDYRAFLRRFAALGEVMRVSDDEFDYVFYTYGLRLYKDMPLVEPLEYREEKRIKQFVIVIDTSGSVQGDIVRSFVDTTFDILKSSECFHEQVQVRIIQCDASVQSDDKITSMDEMRDWGRSMRLYGGGGTDFRPAFEYVDSLVEQGELDNLGGLLYFTDGWGTYPEWMPSYRTAFVFYDENYRPEQVPPWAMQVVMNQDVLSNAAQG